MTNCVTTSASGGASPGKPGVCSRVSLAVIWPSRRAPAMWSTLLADVEKLSVPLERVEQLLHILHGVVCVRRDAEVADARGGDDAVAVERLDERGRIGGGDAEERAAPLGVARRRDAGAERVEAVEQARVEAEDVLARLGDADLLHQLHPRDAGVDGGDRRRPGLEAGRRRGGGVVAG